MIVYNPQLKQEFKDKYVHEALIFLAGSIEMGVAKNWQSYVIDKLSENTFINDSVQVFNPRRDDWDSTWKQEQTNEEFNYQVNWEINHLRKADLILFNFEENTKAPITLWELGRFGRSNNSIVCCPTGFYRYGNIETICTIENIPLFHSLDDAIGALSTKIKQITFNK